jgi:Vitamin K-dependent gamma-carboxylase
VKTPWSWRSFFRGWDQFFFAPADTLTCDIVRILYALIILVHSATNWSHVTMWWGESGVLPYAMSRQVIDAWTLFSYLPHTDEVAWCIYLALTVQAGLLLIGLWPRFQAIGMYVSLISLHHRNLLVLDAEDGVFRVIGFLMILLPLGRHWSVHAWMNRHRAIDEDSTWAAPAGWPLRLLQLEMCLIFFGCGFSKASSPLWMDGSAMYYATRLDDMFQHYPTPNFLWESHRGLQWMGFAVIATELLVPLLVWFRETRWLALALAFLFHLGCEYTMNLYLFHWIMLIGWCSFIPDDAWRRVGRWFAGLTRWHRGKPVSGDAVQVKAAVEPEMPAG